MASQLHRRHFVKVMTSVSASLLIGSDFAGATPVAGDLSARLDAVVRAFVEAEEFSGAALVTRGGKTLLRTAYGIANRITGEPNSPETAYEIASLTKPFTALALVQLAEAGKLSLDDPIVKHLPEVIHGERDGVAVTIRHLLSHTSGVPDFLDFYDVENPFTYPWTLEQLVGDIIARDLEFTPGTEYRYGNSGYIYAGLIIERVSGQSYETYLRERIFAPAGMTGSFLLELPDPAPPESKGYGVANGQLVALSDFARVELIWSAGGLSSTVDDLLRWHEALLTDVLASRSAIAAMYEPVLDSYGLGWERETIAGHVSTGHAGHTIGYDAQLARFLAEDVVIVLLSNYQDAPVAEITEQLAQVVFTG